jgi:hypothetical protein
MCWSGVFIRKVDLPLQQKREDQQLAELSLSRQIRKAREANASAGDKALQNKLDPDDPDDQNYRLSGVDLEQSALARRPTFHGWLLGLKIV